MFRQIERSRLYYIAILLFVLALLDTFFTDFGLRNNHITEANILMRVVYENSVIGFYMIKIILPLLLLVLLLKLQPKKYMIVLVGSALLLYTVVLFQHVWWFSMVMG